MATKQTQAPSTVAENPLADSLARIAGTDPLSASTGTSTSLINYDPEQAFRQPQADVISIQGDPGSGATTAETWSHEIALENLKNEQLQFEYEQQQNEIANALRQQESQRSAAQLAIQQAEEARAAGLNSYQVEAAKLANQSAAYDLTQKQRQEESQRNAAAVYGSLIKQFAFQQNAAGGMAAVTPESVAAYNRQLADPRYVPAQVNMYGTITRPPMMNRGTGPLVSATPYNPDAPQNTNNIFKRY